MCKIFFRIKNENRESFLPHKKRIRNWLDLHPFLTTSYDHSNSIYHHNSDLNTNNILKYNILASKIIRANTIYQVVVSLSSENSDACLFLASISKNGMAITSNQAVIHPDQSQGILLKIPSGKMVFRFCNFDFHEKFLIPKIIIINQ